MDGLEFKLTEGICRDRIAPTIMGAVLSKENWAKLRAEAEAGAADPELSQKWKVSREAIRKHRYDDDKKGDTWKTPKNLELIARQEELAKHFQNKGNAGVGSGAGEQLVTVTQEELSILKETIPAQVAKKSSELLLSSFPLLKMPTNIKDFKTMFQVFMQAAGLDKQGGGVAIQINGMAWESGAEKQAEKPVVIMG
jgi:hypothetical protein